MRYEKYQSIDLPWLKKIPAHWKADRAKYHRTSLKALNKNNDEQNILSLTLKGVIKNNAERPIGLAPADYETYQVFEKNDLVFKLIDLNNIKTSRVGIVNERGIMSSAYIRAITKDYTVIPRYCYYWYTKQYYEEVFNKIGSGVRETINKSELLDMHLPLPPLSEQEQIVKVVDWLFENNFEARIC